MQARSLAAVAVIAAGIAAVLVLSAGAAAALTCSETTLSARGDPSRFEVVAKGQARANWRAKVRAMAALGALYADFNKARDANYNCSESDGQHVCTAVAVPCRD